MAVLCGVYTLFFAVQAAEFAAALGAPLPLTAPDAAAFAVNGFWEFCRILALDLTVLAALHFWGRSRLPKRAYPACWPWRCAGSVPGLRCWPRPSWRCISICTAQRCGAFGLRGCWEHCYWPVFWLRCGCSAASRRHAWPLWQRRSASACCAACLWSASVWMLSWPAPIAIGSFCSATPGRAASWTSISPNRQGKTRTCRGAAPPFACAKTFCHSNTPQGCLLLAQTRTCRGAAPPSCYRKTVLSLESPTGAFIASLRFANANLPKGV